MTNIVDEVSRTNADLRELIDIVRQASGNTNTVVHKTSMGGFIVGIVAGVAIATCVASVWYTKDVADKVHDDIRDLKAWSEVLRSKVAKLEAQQ